MTDINNHFYLSFATENFFTQKQKSTSAADDNEKRRHGSPTKNK